jgi:hypothetical protein
VYCPRQGWVDDPTDNLLPALEHITLGWVATSPTCHRFVE